MIDIHVEIQGTRPLLCNRFTDAAQIAATEGTRMAVNGDKGTPFEQAQARLYLNAEKVPCIPQPNILRCLIDGGVFHKAGKRKVTTQKTSLIPACVDLHGTLIPITHKDPWTVDTRPVRIPSTGGRILCHRPCFNDWALAFDMTVDESMLGLKLARAILDDAGKRIGLGDYRPACKGPFGRFVVTLWKEEA